MRTRLLHLTAIPLISTSLALAGVSVADDLDKREARAMAVTDELFATLSSALQDAVEEGGPENAIGVCRDIAPQLKSELSRETGWRITRVGTRVRNPLLGRADAWEQQVLQQFQESLDDGAAMQDLRHSERVDEPDGQTFRFMRAIGTQEACLACHGTRETRHADTFKVLGELYPHDRAVDYELGDLRGAFSVSMPIGIDKD